MIAEDVRVRTRHMAQALAGAEDAKLGIEGAEETQLALSVLNERWFLLSDLKLGEHDVLDHLLVGPTGVFAIVTVHAHGQDVSATQAGLKCQDQWHPVLQEADLLALRAQQLLRRTLGAVQVQAVVSLACAAQVSVSSTAAVPVVRVDDLPAYVLQLDSMLLVDRVREIVEVARQLETFDREEVDEQSAEDYRSAVGAPGCQRGYVLAQQGLMASTALDKQGRAVGSVGRTYALMALWLGLASVFLVALSAVPALLLGIKVLHRHRRGQLPVLAGVGMVLALVSLIGWLSLGAYQYMNWIERLAG